VAVTVKMGKLRRTHDSLLVMNDVVWAVQRANWGGRKWILEHSNRA
jgi:hypothetical protein